MQDRNELSVKFTESCSDITLGDLQLSRLNESRNIHRDFQDQVQRLLQEVLKVVEYAEQWAQVEAESRYVNYVRESANQRRLSLQEQFVVKPKELEEN